MKSRGLALVLFVLALLTVPTAPAAAWPGGCEPLYCPELWDWNPWICGCECVSYQCCVYYYGPWACEGGWLSAEPELLQTPALENQQTPAPGCAETPAWSPTSH